VNSPVVVDHSFSEGKVEAAGVRQEGTCGQTVSGQVDNFAFQIFLIFAPSDLLSPETLDQFFSCIQFPFHVGGLLRQFIQSSLLFVSIFTGLFQLFI